MSREDKSCENCPWARLPVNKAIRSTHVGCLYHVSEDPELMIRSLQSSSYLFLEDSIMTGWVYNKLRPGSNQDDYNTADVGVITNFCLITPKEAYCSAYNLGVREEDY